MQMRHTFIHMEVSEALKTYADKKIREKIDKFVSKPIEAHMTFSVDRRVHKAHLSVKAGDGFSCEVEHADEEMHAAVDRMVDKLESQLRKLKEKLKAHKNQPTIRHLATESANDRSSEAGALDAEDVIKLEEARKRVTSP